MGHYRINVDIMRSKNVLNGKKTLISKVGRTEVRILNLDT